MANYFGWKDTFIIGWDEQTTYDVKSGSPSFQWMEASSPDISLNLSTEELSLSKSSDFETSKRVVGAQSGSITFSAPLASMASSYDPASPTLALGPVGKLLIDFFGSSSANATDGSTTLLAIASSGSDGDTWVTDSGDLKPGNCYATGNTDGALSSINWVKASSSSEHTLFESSTAIPADDDVVFPTTTLHSTAAVNEPPSRTFKLAGEEADHALLLIGAKPQRLSISLEAGKTPMAEFTYTFTAYEYDRTGGGLAAVGAFQRVPPLMGSKGARLWIEGTAGASAQEDGTCGVVNANLTIECETVPIPCHAGKQGVSDVLTRRRSATFACTIPWSNDWVESGQTENKFNLALEAGTQMSVSLQCGTKAGAFFGVLIPAAYVVAPAELTDSNGLAAFSVTFAPGPYTGDTGSEPATDSIIRLALG